MSEVQQHHRKATVIELNLLKGLALLGVIFQSSISSTLQNNPVSHNDSIMMGMLYHFAKFSAPAFVFIAGFAIIYHQQSRVNYRQYLVGKTADLIQPLIFWSILYFSLSTEVAPFSLEWFKEMLNAIITGSAAPHLWYVVMIFQFHLLYPMIINLFNKTNTIVNTEKQLYLLMAAISSAYLLLMFYSNRFIYNGNALTDSKWLLYTDRSFIAYSFYFILGGVAAQNLSKWRQFVTKASPVVTFLFITFYTWIGHDLLSFSGDGAIRLEASTYLKPSMFLYVFTEILLLYAFVLTIMKTRSVLYQIVQFFGQYSFGAYLSHVLFMGWISSIMSNLDSSLNYYVQGTILFVTTAVFSISFSFLMSSAPFSRILTGHFEKFNWGKGIPVHTPSFIKMKK